MPRVSAAFFTLGAVLLLGGMGLGQYMGASEDFLFAPVHAHINLLVWVTLALFGTFYALTRDTHTPRLANLLGAGDQCFHRSVGAVAHPAIQTKTGCLSDHEVAVADGLHEALDAQPQRRRFAFVVGHR